MTDRRPPDMFTSLQEPPSPSYVRRLAAGGVRTFDFDVTKPGAARSVAAIKAVGGKIVAYHVGGGGGRAWGSVKKGEQVRKFDTPEDLAALTAEVRDLVAKGADAIHFDNTHRMSGKRLEAVADAIKAGGAGFMAKNNPGKWGLVMKRRPDLRPDYAVIENAVHDGDETAAAHEMAKRGVPTYVVDFARPIDKGSGKPVIAADAARWQAANPDMRLLHMSNERFYRHGPETGTARSDADTYSRFRADGSVNPDSIDPAEIAPVNPVTGRMRPLPRDPDTDTRDGLDNPWNPPMKLGGPEPEPEDDGAADGGMPAAGGRGGGKGKGGGRGGKGGGRGKGKGHAESVVASGPSTSESAVKPTSGQAFGVWDRMTASMESGTLHPKVERMYGPMQDAMRHSVEARGGGMLRAAQAGAENAAALSNAELHEYSVQTSLHNMRRGQGYADDARIHNEIARRIQDGRMSAEEARSHSRDWGKRVMPGSVDANGDWKPGAAEAAVRNERNRVDGRRPPGMMKLGGPDPAAVPSREPMAVSPPALSRAKAREQMGHEDLINQGIPEGSDLYHERMQQMRAGKVPMRERSGPGPRSEGPAAPLPDMAGFAAAAHAHHSGEGSAAPNEATGEGNWEKVHEGGRGWANPAVQRAAQAARKGK